MAKRPAELGNGAEVVQTPVQDTENNERAVEIRVLLPRSMAMNEAPTKKKKKLTSGKYSAEKIVSFQGDFDTILKQLSESAKGLKHINFVISKSTYRAIKSNDNAVEGLKLPLSSDRLVIAKENELEKLLDSLYKATKSTPSTTNHLVPYEPLPTVGNFGPSNFFYKQLNQINLEKSEKRAAEYSESLASKGATQSNVTETNGLPNILTPEGFEEAVKTVERARSANPGLSFKILVVLPSETVGTIIGKNGSKIQELRNVTNTQLRVFDPEGGVGSSDDRSLSIVGVPESILHALDLIHTLLIDNF